MISSTVLGFSDNGLLGGTKTFIDVVICEYQCFMNSFGFPV
jgi:hypothetical protein